MTGPILLPVPLHASELVPGQLLVDPLHPSSSSHISSSAAPQLTELEHQASYEDVISHDDEGRLLSSLTAASSAPPQANVLVVRADQMSHTALQPPASAFFDTLRTDTSTQAFLCKIAPQTPALYYVTSTQKLKNPTLRRAVVNERGAIAEAPAAAAQHKLRLPMHTRRDSSMDLEESSRHGGEEEEAVFAVELRKVRCRVGPADEPHSLDDIGYQWSYHAAGQGDRLQLAIGLGKPLEAAELRALAGMPAVGNEEDCTTPDQSYQSDSEDEGQAGF